MNNLRRERLSQRLRAWAALAVGCLMVSAGWAQETNPAVAAFQRFVNGEEPVQEAVVYRRLTKQDGTLVNQEWVRFGYQGDTWYAQRLEPDPANPTNLIPRSVSGMKGASFTHVWTISDNNVHVVDKIHVGSSGPEKNTAFEWNFLQRTLTLGIALPHDGIGNIRWDGLRFTMRAVSEYDQKGLPAKTNTLQGILTLGTNGSPIMASYPDLPKAAVVRYEYGSPSTLLPTAFTLIPKEASEIVSRYEFVFRKLGATDLSNTEGYVPMMFADKKLTRSATLWTNALNYSLINNELVPGFETANPKRTGSLVLGALGTVIASFLALWYRRTKKQEKQKEHNKKVR